MYRYCVLFLLFFAFHGLYSANVLKFDSVSINENDIIIYFKIGWKRSYKSIAYEDEDYRIFDFKGVLVEKTRNISLRDNPFVKRIKLGQYNKSTARIVIVFKDKNTNFLVEPYFQVIRNKTHFIIKITKKDAIGEIIKEHSFVVVVDPGHGGVDPGCISPKRYTEKDIVLQVAKQINLEFMRRNIGIMYLTREKDIFLSLKERSNQAIEKKGDLFISLHIDSYPDNKRVRGLGIYYLSQKGASDKRAEILAEKENTSDKIGGVKPDDNIEVFQILFSLVQSDIIRKSSIFSGILSKHVKKNKICLHGIHQADFAVLKIPKIPAVLIELGFFSNPYDERLLLNEVYQRRIARVIVDAIEEYKNKWYRNI